jgi:TPR repeat protein
MIASIGSGYRPMGKRDNRQGRGARTGETSMARLEMPEAALAGPGEAPTTADTLFELGMMYSSGRSVPIDLVIAHKWFNIAAMKGHAEAAQLRREIASEMSDAQIGQAQRAARDWLKAHPEPVAPPAPSLRAAA